MISSIDYWSNIDSPTRSSPLLIYSSHSLLIFLSFLSVLPSSPPSYFFPPLNSFPFVSSFHPLSLLSFSFFLSHLSLSSCPLLSSIHVLVHIWQTPRAPSVLLVTHWEIQDLSCATGTLYNAKSALTFCLGRSLSVWLIVRMKLILKSF